MIADTVPADAHDDRLARALTLTGQLTNGGAVNSAVLERVALELRLPAQLWRAFVAAVDGTSPERPDNGDVTSRNPTPPKSAMRSSDVRSALAADLDAFGVWFDRVCAHRLLQADEEGVLGRQVQAGLLAEQQLAELDVALHALGARAGQGRRAIHELMRCNVRLVVSIARRYQGHGLDLEDLIQEGFIGLHRACEKFDPSQGWRFSTYAGWWIRQAVSRAVADKGRLVRLPAHLVERLGRLARIEARLFGDLARAPTSDEIAAQMDSDARYVEMLQRVREQPLWLDQPLGEDFTLTDVVSDGGAGDPAQAAEDGDLGAFISRLLHERLDARSSEILRRRFGIGTWRNETLEEIGRDLGLTRERIRQLERKALDRLTALLTQAGYSAQELDAA